MTNYRQVWFVTRPERDPKFHKEALIALQKATDNFTIKWAGNRIIHKKYEETLNQLRVKRNNISNDGSGGRTWAAMLKTFAYCYVNEAGYLVPTKVGKCILKGIKVHQNITKQILTLQIPNAYFLESGFRPKFDPSFKIRPVRFLIKLTNQKELDYYLTKEEITFFALRAKTDDSLIKVTEQIKEFRKANRMEIIKIKESASSYDHRERSDKGARDFETAHSDVAHTFMLISDYTGFVEYIRGEAIRIEPDKSEEVRKEMQYFDERYPFNNRYLISIERMAENNGLDVDSYKASSYGNNKPATNQSKTQLKAKQLMEAYPDITLLSIDEVKIILMTEFSPRESEKIALELRSESAYSGLNNDFVEGYLSEENNLVFEDKTGYIFAAIGFEVTMRPKPLTEVNTEIEILLKYGEKNCGIIDAKNYKKKFPLSANLVSHMVSEYIPNYDGYEQRDVHFFGYVTSSDFSGEKNLEKICQLVKRIIPNREIKGVMLNAKTLLGFLDYCLENNLEKDDRVKLFLSFIENRGYRTFGQLMKKIE